jgi:hypothetical protein
MYISVRVSYNEPLASSLAAQLFHMPLLGCIWLRHYASLFLHCCCAREATPSSFVQIEVAVDIVQCCHSVRCSLLFRH